MKLVIVESPTKAKTLGTILGKDFIVKASMGHIRDLPKSGLGVDLENNFAPQYVVPDKSKKIITELKKDAKASDEVILATDPDREGEAIAWHLLHLISPKHYSRAVFHEITKTAVLEAFEHKGQIDNHLVDAQQARRVLDRLVGYKLSPLLWKKVRYGLSAGRVQSAAIRLIVERERLRNDFVTTEFWKIKGLFNTSKVKKVDFFEAELVEDAKGKLEIANEKTARKIEADLEGAKYFVSKVIENQKNRSPYPPFKTSTLQQACSNVFGFTSSRTMKSAQKLFEKGLITYHRTDSFNLSPAFLNQAAEFISKNFGAKFKPDKPNFYKTKSKNAQEAHEAIRVTSLNLAPQDLHDKTLTADDFKVYSLIYVRALQSQMTPAQYLQTSVDILTDNKYKFRANGSVIVFEGFLAAEKYGLLKKKLDDEATVANSLTETSDQKSEAEVDSGSLLTSNLLPALKEQDTLFMSKLTTTQHFTQPPARYTDASLVKALEELGIGRPSTYAPTIQTIQSRGYVQREGRSLIPQDVTFVVVDMLVNHFPKIVDYGFTAQIEEQLDDVAEGKLKWQPIIKDFYEPFEKILIQKDKELNKHDMTFLGESSEVCPQCGKQLIFKLGKYGKFMSCSGYPDCDYAKPVAEVIQTLMGAEQGEASTPEDYGVCEVCGEGHYILKQGRFGKFLACSGYPKCKTTKPFLQKIGMTCPKCSEGDVVIKKAKRGMFYGCSRYPECDFSSWKKPIPGEVVEHQKPKKSRKKTVEPVLSS